MIGHMIDRTISLNFAESLDENCLYFMTHIDHDISRKILPEYVDYLYTSELNVRVLINHFKVDSRRLVIIPTGKYFYFENHEIEAQFLMRAIDISSSPGKVIFFFQGKEFGNILYLGGGCSNFSAINLKDIINNQDLDTLYVDTAALRYEHDIPNIGTAVLKVVTFLKCYPACRTFIILEDLLDISVLYEISHHIKEQIYVNTETYELLSTLKYSEGFITDYLNARIYIVGINEIQDILQWENYENGETRIHILLTTTLQTVHDSPFIGQMKLDELHIYIYRNYISAQELKLLLLELKPKFVVPLLESDLHLLQEFLNNERSSQHSEISDITKCSDAQYWNHLDTSLNDIFQFCTLKTDEMKSKNSCLDMSQMNSEGNSSAKLRKCSVVLKKLTSDEIQKYCQRNIDRSQLNGQLQIDLKSANISQLEFNTTLERRDCNTSFNEIESKYDDNESCFKKSESEMHDDHKLTCNDNKNINCKKELKIQLTDILKCINFLSNVGLTSKFSYKHFLSVNKNNKRRKRECQSVHHKHLKHH